MWQTLHELRMLLQSLCVVQWCTDQGWTKGKYELGFFWVGVVGEEVVFFLILLSETYNYNIYFALLLILIAAARDGAPDSAPT